MHITFCTDEKKKVCVGGVGGGTCFPFTATAILFEEFGLKNCADF